MTRRPEPQAIWRRTLPRRVAAASADAAALRDARSDERGEGACAQDLLTAGRWSMPTGDAYGMWLGLTSFKHVGIFPEQAANWNFIYDERRALANSRCEGAGTLCLHTGDAMARAAGAEGDAYVDSRSRW